MRVVVEDTCHGCKGLCYIGRDGRPAVDGPIRCSICNGSGISYQPISLEDFAKLFAWGQEMGSNEHGTTIRNVLRVVPQGGTSDG